MKDNVPSFLNDELQRAYYRTLTLIGVLDNIKEWLNQEVSASKQILDDEIDESACEEHSILEGRLECAEGLLSMIDEWENKE